MPPSKHVLESTCPVAHIHKTKQKTNPPQFHKLFLIQAFTPGSGSAPPPRHKYRAEILSARPQAKKERKEREGDHPDPLPLLAPTGGRHWAEARPASKTSRPPNQASNVKMLLACRSVGKHFPQELFGYFIAIYFTFIYFNLSHSKLTQRPK